MSSVDWDMASGRIPNLRARRSGTLSRAWELTSRSVAILTRAREERALSSSSSVSRAFSTAVRQ